VAGRKRSADEGVERLALDWLARRPLTAAELGRRLAAAGHAPAVVHAACRRLAAAGLLDDRELARHYVVARAERLGHGPRRLVGELVRRGVPQSVARAAWRAAVEDGDLDLDQLLQRQIRRRLGARGGRLDRSGYARVYTALLRAGFPAAAAVVALRPHRPPDADDEPQPVEVDHDDLA